VNHHTWFPVLDEFATLAPMNGDFAKYLVKAPAGTSLFVEGDAGEDMYFIHSGRVRIEKNIEGKPETLATMEKGDFFGEMSLLDHVPRTATAIVAEDAELLRVDATNFHKLLEGNIEIAVRMIRKYTARLRDANDRMKQLLKDRRDVDAELQEILKSARTPTSGKTTPTASELAHFLDENGTAFSVSQLSTLIGRQDPVTNIMPDVDLTSVDPHRSVSRRHARLEQRDGQFVLTEEVGVSNGTVVNGKRIGAGETVSLHDGAPVQFGRVSLTFRLGSSR
jgi:CRP-like cAMP-binding protein